MQLSLVAAFIPIVNILWCGGVSANNCSLGKVLLSCGYRGENCVYSALKTCAINGFPTPNECSLTEDLVLEVKNITNTLTGVQTLLQEVKMEQQNEMKKIAKLEAAINSMLKIKNCAELRVLGDEFSGGVQTVYPYGSLNPKSTTVYCDQVTDGGGWTVIQSRSPLPTRENFTRSWNEYVEGFGDLKGEFWIGLDNIHALTNSAQMALRIDLEDAEGKKGWALYSAFHVGDAASEYVLSIGGYSGDAGDGMTDPSYKDWNINGMKFSTQDNDNDLWSRNCAEGYKGGWWFNACADARLNGLPIVGKDPNSEGIRWLPFRVGYQSLKKATMKIRPVSLGF